MCDLIRRWRDEIIWEFFYFVSMDLNLIPHKAIGKDNLRHNKRHIYAKHLFNVSIIEVKKLLVEGPFECNVS